jgi:hypothetical protein
MTNTNCLENIKCPNCGNEESFRIAAKTIATVTNDGTEDYGDLEWDDDSYAECTECHRHGILKDFGGRVIAKATAALPADRSPLELTEDEFDARFPLFTNHLNPNASWGSGNEGGCLFETYGEELEFVRRQNPRTVWTVVDGDGDDQYLVSGFHFVNRIGYLVSTLPLPEDMDIEVRVPNGNADDPETDESLFNQ